MEQSGHSSPPRAADGPLQQTGAPSQPPDHAIAPDGSVDRPLPEEDRADLILFLGVISFLMCWPLGIVTWIMAASDLGSIRGGRPAHRRLWSLKVGKALGIAGTLTFIVSLGVIVTAVHRGFDTTADAIGLPGLLSRPSPLPADRIVFVGDWVGHRGTFIRINPDGTAAFRSRDYALQGGRVSIDESSVSIVAAGISKTWTIERAPAIKKNGTWKMKLNGEVFRRRARGLTVERKEDSVVAGGRRYAVLSSRFHKYGHELEAPSPALPVNGEGERTLTPALSQRAREQESRLSPTERIPSPPLRGRGLG